MACLALAAVISFSGEPTVAHAPKTHAYMPGITRKDCGIKADVGPQADLPHSVHFLGESTSVGHRCPLISPI